MCTHILLIIVNCIALYLASPPPLRLPRRHSILPHMWIHLSPFHSPFNARLCTRHVHHYEHQPTDRPTSTGANRLSQYPLCRPKCIFFICVIGDECDRYDYCTCNGYTSTHRWMNNVLLVFYLIACSQLNRFETQQYHSTSAISPIWPRFPAPSEPIRCNSFQLR